MLDVQAVEVIKTAKARIKAKATLTAPMPCFVRPFNPHVGDFG